MSTTEISRNKQGVFAGMNKNKTSKHSALPNYDCRGKNDFAKHGYGNPFDNQFVRAVIKTIQQALKINDV